MVIMAFCYEFETYIYCFRRAVTGVQLRVQSRVQFRVQSSPRCPVRYWTCPCPVPTGHATCHVQLHNMWLDMQHVLTGHAGYHSAAALQLLPDHRPGCLSKLPGFP
jgi:hypothetical protein